MEEPHGEPLVLEAKKCAFILIDMTNAITKGQGPPYTTPPHREGSRAELRPPGGPLPQGGHARDLHHRLSPSTEYRRSPKTLADAGPTGGAPMLAGTPAVEIIEELRHPKITHHETQLMPLWDQPGYILNALGTETLLVGGISYPRSVEYRQGRQES